jgi:signal transduction histidine kinase
MSCFLHCKGFHLASSSFVCLVYLDLILVQCMFTWIFVVAEVLDCQSLSQRHCFSDICIGLVLAVVHNVVWSLVILQRPKVKSFMAVVSAYGSWSSAESRAPIKYTLSSFKNCNCPVFDLYQVSHSL